MSSTPPLVSVVIPAFNAERWLPAALDSILRQSHRDLEIIIVDDGSRDKTPGLLDKAASLDPRIKVVRFQKNSGIVAALNEGLSHARGDFIARMDADDIALPERFERQLAYMSQNRLDLCGSWVVEFGMGFPRAVKLPSDSPAVHTHLLFQNVICHPTVIARREVFEGFKYRHDHECAEDYDLFARASAHFRLGNYPGALLRYRRSPGQITLARRAAMQAVCDRVRGQLLRARGISFTEGELDIHNSIRAAESMGSLDSLDAAEAWLLKLCAYHDEAEAKAAVASQWARACVRAAPLGMPVWRRYRCSGLRRLYRPNHLESLDMLVLAMLRLKHEGATFQWLRRLGLSA